MASMGLDGGRAENIRALSDSPSLSTVLPTRCSVLRLEPRCPTEAVRSAIYLRFTCNAKLILSPGLLFSATFGSREDIARHQPA